MDSVAKTIKVKKNNWQIGRDEGGKGMNKVNNLLSIIWLRLIHPSVETNGIHQIRIGTEIIQKANGHIIVGNRVSTQKNVTLAVVGGIIQIGENVSFNRYDIVACYEKILIGNNCAFGPNVIIYDHDHKYNTERFNPCEYKTSPVIIEDNCWIGANVTILRGAHIGEGCVIGAGSVVKENIPPHSIVTLNRELKITRIEER